MSDDLIRALEESEYHLSIERLRVIALRQDIACARATIEAVRELLERNGCDCECGHHHEEHNHDCELCLACLISEAVA